MPKITGNQAVEAAAIAWVLGLERAAGRSPADRHKEKAFGADIDSPPRVIEVKSSVGSYRNWPLPLAGPQVKRGLSDPNFYVYVVENVGQGDPAKFSLKVLHGDRLRSMLERAVPQTSHAVPWPVANYDTTPTTLDGE